jgi:hypothetical protein
VEESYNEIDKANVADNLDDYGDEGCGEREAENIAKP